MLGLSAKGAGLFALTASGLSVPKVLAGGGGGGGSVYVEAFPTSPVILNPFTDELGPLKALAPVGKTPATANLVGGHPSSPTGAMPAPSKLLQDCFGPSDQSPEEAAKYEDYNTKYGLTIGTHQIWPDELNMPEPLVYHIKVMAAYHTFTSSQVQPINSFGKAVARPGTKNSGAQSLPPSCIWGFNGQFPGPRINAEYGQPALVRFENCLDEKYDHGADGEYYDPLDFGSPARSFLTHMQNGHTAPESDGNPHYAHYRFSPRTLPDGTPRLTHFAAFLPGEWIDQLYLGYAAGSKDDPANDICQKQSFFWFHDHVHGHTGANVYKGMVGIMPLYDPVNDCGDETKGYRLPGVRTNNPDGSFDVEYDLPFALYDCRLDDGVTPHKDAHNGNGETHAEWWGKSYFRHFPNHGFVGDIFTVNGTAYPVLKVKRRKYRMRFLDASISRIYDLSLMTSKNGPKLATQMGYTGDELQGQWRLPDGVQCHKWVQVASGGGLLPNPIVRDSFELWPAKRREVVVDFSRWGNGKPTADGDVLWLVNTMKMTTGRMWDSKDSNYKIPLMKIVIEEEKDAHGNILPPPVDNSMVMTTPAGEVRCDVLNESQIQKYPVRPQPPVKANWQSILKQGVPTFELQRGGSSSDPETEWLINGQAFTPEQSMISVERDSEAVWKIRNGGGGWVHPMHLHMEEHVVLMRNGKLAPDARHPDDTGKEDVVALDPSEEVVISRSFRTFTGPYVAHCHNLAHEDHNMMFGWDIKPPKTA
jgi:FtsP/CotA-like multicopper oxidase with cupredoxin domain